MGYENGPFGGFGHGGPVAGAGYCGPVGGAGHGAGNGFALIVVLFILLIIVGAVWFK
ncbi:YjcZ family sporulation protein [Oceanobacillus longus]|uniref:YjcZ family sporulation protein n=1 Tax=Oceanobacillus longus TaxID=930120 RepID=A0ABV8GUB1_9BACI